MKIKVKKCISDKDLTPYATVLVSDGFFETIFYMDRSWTFHSQLTKEGFKNSYRSGIDVEIDVTLDEVQSTIDLVNRTYRKVCSAYKQLEESK